MPSFLCHSLSIHFYLSRYSFPLFFFRVYFCLHSARFCGNR
ncbi:hypothetical protein HMPREF9446_01886 [Bacteroides fluxus YIT 12057]|uniref:Uncharacterized protein n=1 Tax=Bacteroides fluxus YIT 12057 TaxID=763034 RepID=F3PT20_9BACE|nr:hypothetical protein HMPREF9446_01886 [Bacteroides fluxus YIT 12057]